MGRLSNPAEPIKTLTGQGKTDPRQVQKKAPKRPRRSSAPSEAVAQETPGRLSKPLITAAGADAIGPVPPTSAWSTPTPIQRRLRAAEVDELVAAYHAGDSLEHLAARLGVHRTTVMAHLDRRAVERHTRGKEWDEEALASATDLYAHGESLAGIGERYGVDASTVANRFRRAGVAIRPRRGWSRRPSIF